MYLRRWNQLAKEAAKEQKDGKGAPLPPFRLSNGGIHPSIADFLRRIRGTKSAAEGVYCSGKIDFEADYIHSSDEDAEDEDLSVLAEADSSILKHTHVNFSHGACLLNSSTLTPNINVAGHKPLVHNFVGAIQSSAKLGTLPKEPSLGFSLIPSGNVTQSTPEKLNQGDSFAGFSNMSSLINGALGTLQADAPLQESTSTSATTRTATLLSKRNAEEPQSQPLKRRTSLFSMVTQSK